MSGKVDLKGREFIMPYPIAPELGSPVIESNETHLVKEDIVTIAGKDSFPASDPPSWTLGREPRTD